MMASLSTALPRKDRLPSLGKYLTSSLADGGPAGQGRAPSPPGPGDGAGCLRFVLELVRCCTSCRPVWKCPHHAQTRCSSMPATPADRSRGAYLNGARPCPTSRFAAFLASLSFASLSLAGNPLEAKGSSSTDGFCSCQKKDPSKMASRWGGTRRKRRHAAAQYNGTVLTLHGSLFCRRCVRPGEKHCSTYTHRKRNDRGSDPIICPHRPAGPPSPPNEGGGAGGRMPCSCTGDPISHQLNLDRISDFARYQMLPRRTEPPLGLALSHSLTSMPLPDCSGWWGRESPSIYAHAV